MSIHTNLARLREAAATAIRGEAPETCRVRREDLRIALDVIDRLDVDLRRIGAISHGHMNDLQAPAGRLLRLADEALAEYNAIHAAGGEPVYPAWVDDVRTLCAAPSATLLCAARAVVAADDAQALTSQLINVLRAACDAAADGDAREAIQAAVNSIERPRGLTDKQWEFVKAGARLVVRRVNAIAAQRQGEA